MVLIYPNDIRELTNIPWIVEIELHELFWNAEKKDI